jgi:ubiquinone/menaquinone biosynthesis C-methylase UbiE
MYTKKSWSDYWKDKRPGRRFTESARSLLYSRMMVSFLNSYMTPKTKVLEAGCGSGSFAKFIKGEYYGIDWSLAALEIAGSRIKARGRLYNGDITDMPFPRKKFSILISQGILEFIDDWKPFLSEFDRVTKDHIFIIFPSRVSVPGILSAFSRGHKDNKIFKRVYLTAEEIRSRAEGYVKVVQVKRVLTAMGYSLVLVAKPLSGKGAK